MPETPPGGYGNIEWRTRTTERTDGGGVLQSFDPKLAAGSIKASLDNVSIVAQYYEAAVMATGTKKYGAYNWCDNRMKASTYYNAMLRHLYAWWIGEDIDPESGLPHIAHLRSCTGIILDQQEAGRLVDDRPKNLAPTAPAVKVILDTGKDTSIHALSPGALARRDRKKKYQAMAQYPKDWDKKG